MLKIFKKYPELRKAVEEICFDENFFGLDKSIVLLTTYENSLEALVILNRALSFNHRKIEGFLKRELQEKAQQSISVWPYRAGNCSTGEMRPEERGILRDSQDESEHSVLCAA